MKFLNNIKILFTLVILLMLIIIVTISNYYIKRESEIKNSYNINTLRAYTSSVMNTINNEYPIINHDNLSDELNELGIKALISDLKSNVEFNNTSFEIENITHEIYQDQSYEVLNKDFIKVSFLIINSNEVVGIVIFEIPKDVIVKNDNYSLIILMIIELVMISIISLFLVIKYNKNIIKPIKVLDNALLDISNGIYKKIVPENGVSLNSFTYYNYMLEKMEDTISNQADYAKSRKQLIANISHEVRTPLSYVKMSAEMLSNDKNISEKNRKYVNTILTKINSIDGIIEDLFRYSKQDMNMLLVELKETYTKDMFERIFKNIKSKYDNPNIKIKASNEISNVIINADESRLVQVVSNMVDNAEKHIKGIGEIKIKTQIEENHLILTIEDNGEGINSKDLPYIFEPFYQGIQDDDIKKKGSGLGLSICDYIIKKHNGEIFVHTEKDIGTKFVIKFQELL